MALSRVKEITPAIYERIRGKVFVECGNGTPCAYRVVGHTKCFVYAEFVRMSCEYRGQFGSDYKVDWNSLAPRESVTNSKLGARWSLRDTGRYAISHKDLWQEVWAFEVEDGDPTIYFTPVR